MLSDDQLIHDLTRAFHIAADDLTYTGAVPTPRTAVLPAVPVLAAAAALVAVPVVLGQHTDAPTSHRDQARSAPPSAASPGVTPPSSGLPTTGSTRQSRLITGPLRLAGYRITLGGEAARNVEVYAVRGVELPTAAVPLHLAGVPDAFSGTDAVTGDAAVFVRVSADEGAGRVFELTSSGLTAEQLAELLTPDNAVPVPLVYR